MLDPFQPLLSTKNEFLWSEEFQATFDAIKRTLTTTPILSYFNPEKPTRLCTDASRKGLGFVLQQRDGEQWKLVQAGSRFLSDAESRYTIIELEMLAIAWAVTKCNIFLAGLQQFLMITDHHPLIPILNSHRLDEIENTRLQRLRTKLMRYNFKAEWLKGDHNKGPDALSRYPNSDPSPRDALAESDLDDDVAPTVAHIRTVMAGTHDSIAENSRLQKLQQAAMSDQEYQALKHYVLNGFPKQRHELPEGCRQYWKIRADLSIEETLETTEAMKRAYNQHARPLPDLTVGTMVAVQDPGTKYWDIYGVITDIGHHRRYFVKTQSGRVLVRNRRFLRKRTPLSTIPLEMPPLAEGQQETTQDHHDGRTNPTAAQHQPPLRRSMRSRKTTSCLIETYHLQQGGSRGGGEM